MADGGTLLPTQSRVDLKVIAELVAPGGRVLDVGCGDGALLDLLAATRGVDGRGIELSQQGVNACVARGLSVIQGDADTDLGYYPDDAFDYVILSQTLQATNRPKDVLRQLLRIGRRAIVSVPNFGHYRVRLQFLKRGRMPVTEHLPYSWYNTPNIHFCTLQDFVDLTRETEVGAVMEETVALDVSGRRISLALPWWAWNMLAEQAVFVLRRAG